MILLSNGTRSARTAFRKGSLSQPLYQVGVSFSSTSSAEDNDNVKIRSTRKWFERIVVGEKLCPFASPLLKDPELMRVVSSKATNEQEALVGIQEEVHNLVGLQHPPKHETTLVVFDEQYSFVKDYLEFVRLSWTLQEQAVGEMYQSKLQLVLFHPLATHQTYGAMSTGDDDDDDDDSLAADYTIRSPYPTIHLLREEDVLKAVNSGYPELEYLPSRNKAKLVAQGIKACRQRLQDCYDNDK